MPQRIEVIPSARRMIGNLRDIGYEVHTAVADIVDNSIDAHATMVDITVTFNGADSCIRITDNGTGITTQRLNDAMRYGSDRDYSAAQLGKYGLGLKTASMSNCRQLTVATRTNVDRRSIEIRRWDLDSVERRDTWEIERLSPSEVAADITDPLQDQTGTVVYWTKLDRILSYRSKEGLWAEYGLNQMCAQIEEHLGMVFHRFLSQTAQRVLPLTITINGQAIDAWDPFARAEKHTVRLKRSVLQLRHEGQDHHIVVEPYILPAQELFSSPEARDHYAGPSKWQQQQGFYFYRGDRLIQSGGWNRLRALDEHAKLARIAVDIPRSADSAFGINITKMRVTLPEMLRGELKTIASAVVAEAGRAYRTRSAPTGRPDRRRPEPPAPQPATVEPSGGGIDHVESPSPRRSSELPPGGMLPVAIVEGILRQLLGGQPQLLERVLRTIRTAVQ